MAQIVPPSPAKRGRRIADQFAAKQYSSPSPPVLRRSACEQPPSGPREGCELFQDFDASSPFIYDHLHEVMWRMGGPACYGKREGRSEHFVQAIRMVQS